MKTTIEISDHLLFRAKLAARERNTTLRGLTEEGLRRVLYEEEGEPCRTLDPVTFRGRGLQPSFRDGGWDAIRDEAYRGRGS